MKIARRPTISYGAMISCGTILLLGSGAVRGAPPEFHQLESYPKGTSSSPPDPIPQSGYKSWSLFLISSPEWLLGQTKEKLSALYEQFQIFGNAIGPENLALWFWSDPKPFSVHERAVDVPRSVAICKRLKLKPSEGPYVVVMTKYPGKCILKDPDSFPKEITPGLTIKLNGNDAARTTHLLGVLADKLLTEDLSKLQSKPAEYWDGWRNVFTKVNTLVTGLSSRVTVAFNTGPLKTEIKLGP